MTRTTSLILGALIFVLSASFVLKGDTSSIENKVYKITITEQKNGKSGKAEQGECSFKSQKFKCKFFGQNAGAEEIQIDLDKDSTYTEEGSDVELLYVEFSGSRTNKLEEDVKITGTIDGYGIEGSVELSKKGKVKKHWDFVGNQKDKKK
jgi:RNA-binding protein YlmH